MYNVCIISEESPSNTSMKGKPAASFCVAERKKHTSASVDDVTNAITLQQNENIANDEFEMTSNESSGIHQCDFDANEKVLGTTDALEMSPSSMNSESVEDLLWQTQRDDSEIEALSKVKAAMKGQDFLNEMDRIGAKHHVTIDTQEIKLSLIDNSSLGGRF